MRDRLIEILKGILPTKGVAGGIPLIQKWDYGAVADHLLENGVIVPPCKVGDAIWFIEKGGTIGFSLVEKITFASTAAWNNELTFSGVYLVGFLGPIPFKEIGRSVFLTKEEAEQALKEREKV